MADLTELTEPLVAYTDLATAYANHSDIGKVLGRKFGKGGGLNRDQVWLTSKLFNTDHESARVPKALKETLQELQVMPPLRLCDVLVYASYTAAHLKAEQTMPAG